ncbi:MAG: transposase, partial [Clostridium sp.]
QRQCSNKYEKNKKGKEYVKTKNIAKLQKQVRLLHRRLANIRVNHLHQATSMIVKTKPSRVVMETLCERSYVCENCGCAIDRYYNASINLSRYSA